MTKKMKKIVTNIIIVLMLVVSISNVLPNSKDTVFTSSKVAYGNNKSSVATIDKNSKVTANVTGSAITVKVNNKNDIHKMKTKLTKKQLAAYKAYKKFILYGKGTEVRNSLGKINNNLIKYVTANPDTYLFTLIDLNGDHIDELFIKDGHWNDSYGYNSWVFSYNPKDKKVYNIIWDDLEGTCSYTPLKNGVLLERYWYAGGQSDSFVFYKLGLDNKPNKVKELNYFVGDWADLPPYSIDKKKVTKKVWKKALKSNFTDNRITKEDWHNCKKEVIKKYLK